MSISESNLLSAVLNGGTPLEGSNSIVKSIRLTFDKEVVLTVGAVGMTVRPNVSVVKNGETLLNQSYGTVPQYLDAYPVDYGKIWDIKFRGDVDADSICNGAYNFFIDYSKIFPIALAFHRMFGDIDGVGDDGWARVNTSDSGPFGLAFGSHIGQDRYNPSFDANGDGQINMTDKEKFDLSFLTSIKYK